MEVHFPPELEAKLTHSAARQGRNPDELPERFMRRPATFPTVAAPAAA
jgi:hypothetical protein